MDPLQTLTAEMQQTCIEIGRGYSSHKVRDTANRHAEAHKAYGAQLAAHGFSAEQMDAVRAMAAGYPEGLEQRTLSGLTKQESAAAGAAARRQGKLTRRTCRAHLTSALLNPALPAEQRRLVTLALQNTSALDPDRADALITHLTTLRAAADTLGLKALSAQAAADAQALSDAHDAATRHRGTKPDTQALDLRDGALITYLRAANQAAKAAAKATGNPDIAAAFSLKGLR